MHKHDYIFAAPLRHGKIRPLISMYAHVLIYYSLPGPGGVRAHACAASAAWLAGAHMYKYINTAPVIIYSSTMYD